MQYQSIIIGGQKKKEPQLVRCFGCADLKGVNDRFHVNERFKGSTIFAGIIY